MCNSTSRRNWLMEWTAKSLRLFLSELSRVITEMKVGQSRQVVDEELAICITDPRGDCITHSLPRNISWRVGSRISNTFKFFNLRKIFLYDCWVLTAGSSESSDGVPSTNSYSCSIFAICRTPSSVILQCSVLIEHVLTCSRNSDLLGLRDS